MWDVSWHLDKTAYNSLHSIPIFMNSFVINWGNWKWCWSLVGVEFIDRANLIKYLDWHIIWGGVDVVCPSGGAAARRQRRPTLLRMLPSHHIGTHTVYRQPQQQPLYDSKVYTPKQSYNFCKNQKTAFNSSSLFWDVSSDWQLIVLNSSLSCFPFPFTSVCISAFLKSSAAC